MLVAQAVCGLRRSARRAQPLGLESVDKNAVSERSSCCSDLPVYHKHTNTHVPTH